jgi:hypothetical protein
MQHKAAFSSKKSEEVFFSKGEYLYQTHGTGPLEQIFFLTV